MKILAEAGPCEGDVAYALRAAQAVKDAGADALKVQWYHPEKLTSPTAARYDETGGPQTLQAEILYKFIYPYEEWAVVYEMCDSLGIDFIPACFDFEAVDVASQMGLPWIKVASGDITHWPLLKRINRLGFERVTLSTGASTLQEMADAIFQMPSVKEIDVLACHLQYPTSLLSAELGRIAMLRAIDWSQFGENRTFHVGYSDHTPYDESMAAMLVTLGAEVWEKHFTLLTPDEGGDHMFAVIPEELADMVDSVRIAREMLGSGLMDPTEGELPARVGARRHVVAGRDIALGEKISVDDLEFVRPAPESPLFFSPAEWMLAGYDEKKPRAMLELKKGTAIQKRWVGFVGGTLSVE